MWLALYIHLCKMQKLCSERRISFRCPFNLLYTNFRKAQFSHCLCVFLIEVRELSSFVHPSGRAESDLIGAHSTMYFQLHSNFNNWQHPEEISHSNSPIAPLPLVSNPTHVLAIKFNAVSQFQRVYNWNSPADDLKRDEGENERMRVGEKEKGKEQN